MSTKFISFDEGIGNREQGTGNGEKPMISLSNWENSTTKQIYRTDIDNKGCSGIDN
ncbi:MAG: hypothetical protein AAGF83_08000 [Cyanobacteria bacterium P01_G01_bin.67]